MPGSQQAAGDNRTSLGALELAHALLHSEVARRAELMEHLAALGADGWPALPVVLYIAVGDESSAVQLRALNWLAGTERGGGLIVRTCTQALLRESREEMQLSLVATIAAHRSFVSHALPALMDIVRRDRDASPLAESALQAAQWGGASLAPHMELLSEVCDVGARPLRPLALRCITALAVADESHRDAALHHLRQVLGAQSSDGESLSVAFEGLSALGSGAAAAATDILGWLESGTVYSETAWRVLRSIGPAALLHAGDLVPRLLKRRDHGMLLIALNAIAPDSLPLVWGDDPRVSRSLHSNIGHNMLPEDRRALVVAIDALLEKSRGINWEQRLIWGMRELIFLGAVRSLVHWLSALSSTLPVTHDELLLLDAAIRNEQELTATQMLTLASWQPALRTALAGRLANGNFTVDAMIPPLLAWLSQRADEESGSRLAYASADALCNASASREWLRDLLLHRLASLGSDAPSGLAERLAAGLFARSATDSLA